MTKAHDLQKLADDAYDSFKGNPANVSQVDATYQKVIAAAKVHALLGEFSCLFGLGDLSIQTANVFLFLRLLRDKLEAQDLIVSYRTTVKENWIIVAWSSDPTEVEVV